MIRLKKNGDELKEKAEEELDTQDVDENFQVITAPTIDENFVGQRIQVKFEMDELDDVTGGKKLIWYKGKVILVKTYKSSVRVKWDDENEPDSDETLLKTKWNKQTEESWRMDVGKYKTLKNK